MKKVIIKSSMWINTFFYWLLVYGCGMLLVKAIFFGGLEISLSSDLTLVFSTLISVLILLLLLPLFFYAAKGVFFAMLGANALISVFFWVLGIWPLTVFVLLILWLPFIFFIQQYRNGFPCNDIQIKRK